MKKLRERQESPKRLGEGKTGYCGNRKLALQLPFMKISESMGNHDSKIVDAGSVG